MSEDINSILPHGRAAIGVGQGQPTSQYPLVEPSDDVRDLLADFSLTYDPLSEYNPDIPEYTLPFRVHWLSGFGTEIPDYPIPEHHSHSWDSVCNSSISEESGCLPLPKHGHDLIILDADGRTVFDSTIVGLTYETRTWGDRLRIVMWRHPSRFIVSVVYHTAWSPNDFPVPKNYPTYFFPDAAILDARTIHRLPRRVRTLSAVLTSMLTRIDLASGYNMQIGIGETTTTDGARKKTRITFNAVPGAGLGTFPDCIPGPLYIRTVNGTPPTNQGDFYFSASGCYWARQPLREISPGNSHPEIALVPGSIPDTNLPDPDAGTTTNAAGWPYHNDPRYAHLQFGNDCSPCVDCADYAAVASYMNTIRDNYQAVGKKLEGTRDLYHINRERWLTAAACIAQTPIRTQLVPQICPFMDVAVQYCNQSGACQLAVELVVTMSTTPADGSATEVPGLTFATGTSLLPGKAVGAHDRYKMRGVWPTFSAFFDMVPPGKSVSARFRLQFANCGMVGNVPYTVTAVTTGTSQGVTLRTPDGAPATTTTVYTLACPVTPGAAPLNYQTCACNP